MTLSLEALGFGLRHVETRDNSRVFSLESPFRLLTESPFDVFVEHVGDKFHIFDDGLTLHEILVAGVDMSSRYKWESLRKIVGNWGVSFSRTGVFESYSSINRIEETTSNYLRAMISVDDWIAEQALNRKSIDTLIEDSKNFLKRWWQTEEIVNHPRISAVYGEQLEFDFKIKDTYVDVISPSKVSSASTVRKLLAIPRDSKTFVVIDDRPDPKKAEQEKYVVSRLSDTIFFTKLAQNATEFAPAA